MLVFLAVLKCSVWPQITGTRQALQRLGTVGAGASVGHPVSREVGQQVRTSGSQGPAEPVDLGDRAGRDRVEHRLLDQFPTVELLSV